MMETYQVPETLCSLVSRISNGGQSEKNLIILSIIQHRQNPLENNFVMQQTCSEGYEEYGEYSVTDSVK
jgi:hypothetical protein